MGFWNVLFGILNIENLFPLSGVGTGQTVVLSMYLSNREWKVCWPMHSWEVLKDCVIDLKRAIGFLLCMLLLCGGLFWKVIHITFSKCLFCNLRELAAAQSFQLSWWQRRKHFKVVLTGRSQVSFGILLLICFIKTINSWKSGFGWVCWLAWFRILILEIEPKALSTLGKCFYYIIIP